MRRIECEHCGVRTTKDIIRDLPASELDNFRTCGSSALYKHRQVIFHEGTPANGLYILCHGAVKLYQSDRFGHDHILDIAVPGDVLGELPLDPTECYSVSAEAIADSQLCYLPRERLVAFIQEHPMTGVRLIEALSKSLSTARKRVRALALKRAENRLAELLIHLAQATGEPVANGNTRLKLNYSRRELAEMIGVSPETVIRLLSRLKQKRAISTRHRELVITDAEKLSRLANHDSLAAA
jgi:CRP/FNR family transcriptional regulator, polysaccharide utilization system transcription regulator